MSIASRWVVCEYSLTGAALFTSKEKRMKELNTTEIQAVAGGCGPGMFDGLLEGAIALCGIGIVVAFALGVGSVMAYQYYTTQRV